MKQDIKQKWVEALRSGQYKQGKGYLQMGGCFCCLGVLCDISEKGKWTERVGDPSKHYVTPVDNEMTFSLPKSMMEEYNITPHDTDFLIGMNDENSSSFQEISDYIEKNL